MLRFCNSITSGECPEWALMIKRGVAQAGKTVSVRSEIEGYGNYTYYLLFGWQEIMALPSSPPIIDGSTTPARRRQADPSNLELL